jgi:DNA-binding NarL/FixJ family response regulator
MPRKITVLLVDDHALVRRGFRRMLEDDSEISVVAEASDGPEAVRLALELRPQVIVMDCALPEFNGIEATRRIRKEFPAVEILMLSMHSEETLVRQALDAGARGYVLKNAMELDLVSAVKTVALGKPVLDPQVSKPASLKGERGSGLTTRELEILQHIVAGKSNKEIAVDLGLSSTLWLCIMPTLWMRWAFTSRRVSGVRHSQRAGQSPMTLGLRGVWVSMKRRQFVAAAGTLASTPPRPRNFLAGHHGTGVYLRRYQRGRIQFQHNSGAFGGKFLPETLGSGCAFLDYDNDGWQDILLVNGMTGPGTAAKSTLRLYRNNRNGSFTDVTRAALDIRNVRNGVAIGGYNNDGFRIFHKLRWASHLFHNKAADSRTSRRQL